MGGKINILSEVNYCFFNHLSIRNVCPCWLTHVIHKMLGFNI